MTAPDVNADVRARFEAWLLDREIKTPRRPNGYYQSDETCFWWRLWQDAYRAAHADLSGEVRELVEAARNVADERHRHSALGSKDGGESCGICGHNWRSGVHLRAGESEQADKLRLKAALAKFHPTHQETK